MIQMIGKNDTKQTWLPEEKKGVCVCVCEREGEG